MDIIYFNPSSLADRAGRRMHSYGESRIPEVARRGDDGRRYIGIPKPKRISNVYVSSFIVDFVLFSPYSLSRGARLSVCLSLLVVGQTSRRCNTLNCGCRGCDRCPSGVGMRDEPDGMEDDTWRKYSRSRNTDSGSSAYTSIFRQVTLAKFFSHFR